MENLLLTSGYGYEPDTLAPFLGSVAATLDDSDVVLFYHRGRGRRVEALKRALPRVRIVVPRDRWLREALSRLPRGRGYVARWLAGPGGEPVSPPARAGGPLPRSAAFGIAVARYLWAREALQSPRARRYRHVMLCDSRDVVFQRSDFWSRAGGGGLVTGEEEKVVGDCSINSGWLEHCYGSGFVEQVRDEPVLCSGVTFGTAHRVIEYVDRMVAHIDGLGARIALENGYDQGIHNYIIRSGELSGPVVQTPTDEGVIASLHHYPGERLGPVGEGVLSLGSGVVPAIVHQYNRHPGLPEAFAERYGAS